MARWVVSFPIIMITQQDPLTHWVVGEHGVVVTLLNTILEMMSYSPFSIALSKEAVNVGVLVGACWTFCLVVGLRVHVHLVVCTSVFGRNGI